MKRLDLSRPLAAGYCALAFTLGAGTASAYSAYQQHRTSYYVIVAGDTPDLASHFRKLVDAEYTAHELAACPETEQEAGRAILILDQDGRLVDTISRG